MRVLVEVPDLKAGGSALRGAGILDDGMTMAVCRRGAGETTATTELSMPLGEAVDLAERVLSGDARAATTPGLARILSASVAILFRVALTSGAIIRDGDDVGGNPGH